MFSDRLRVGREGLGAEDSAPMSIGPMTSPAVALPSASCCSSREFANKTLARYEQLSEIQQPLLRIQNSRSPFPWMLLSVSTGPVGSRFQ